MPEVATLLANVDWATLVSGGAICEAVRTVGKAIRERREEEKKNRRRLLAAEIGAARAKVQPLPSKALTYYGAPSAQGKATSTELKRDLKLFALEWNTINQQCRRFARDELLIRFRQALTRMLDVKRDHALSLEDYLIEHMAKACLDLQNGLQPAESKLQ